MKKIFFGKNLRFLRKSKGFNQDEMPDIIGFKRTTWSGYETEKSFPKFEDLIKISEYFGISEGDLINLDLENVAPNKKEEGDKTGKNVALNVAPNVALTGKKGGISDDFKITIVAEDAAQYGRKIAHVPITDISVAAGGGVYNDGHLETVEAVHFPPALLKPGHTYLCVRIKGQSMSPTLQDGGYVVIRLLDKSEWAKMPDERVFVVVDTDGKAYLKRVKNRFKQGFIVLRSDSPEQAIFPSFNLQTNEITAIWYVEWYLSAKMPNIHDQYYTRLQQLEDRVDTLQQNIPKINR